MISTSRRRVLSASPSATAELVEPGASGLDVAALELAHLEQLGVREGGLERAAARQDRDLLEPAGIQHLDRVVSGVCDGELGRGQREHPRDVDRDVARPDDHRLPGAQVYLSPEWSGWPWNQATNSVAGCEPRRSSPGISSRLSVAVPIV